MKVKTIGLLTAMLSLPFVALTASAQEGSIYVQCPASTDLHPTGGGIKCGHLVAGDGMVTMADDTRQEAIHLQLRRSPENLQGAPGLAPRPEQPEYASWVMAQGMLAANAPAPTIVGGRG